MNSRPSINGRSWLGNTLRNRGVIFNKHLLSSPVRERLFVSTLSVLFLYLFIFNRYHRLALHCVILVLLLKLFTLWATWRRRRVIVSTITFVISIAQGAIKVVDVTVLIAFLGRL